MTLVLLIRQAEKTHDFSSLEKVAPGSFSWYWCYYYCQVNLRVASIHVTIYYVLMHVYLLGAEFAGLQSR